MVYLNYTHLTKPNLANILRQAFDYNVAADQLALMQSQFAYYSKDDSNATHFVSDKAAKQKAALTDIRAVADREVAALYDQLEQSDKNFDLYS